MPRLQIFRYPRGGIRVLPLSLPEPFGRNKSGGKAPIVGKLFVVASSDDSCRIRGLMYDGFSALFRRLQYLEEKERGAECSLGTGGKAPVYLCRPLGEDSRRLLGQQLIVPIDTYYHNTSVRGEEEGQFFPFLRILCRPPFFYSYISYRESFHAKFSILIESSLKSRPLRRKISRNPRKKIHPPKLETYFALAFFAPFPVFPRVSHTSNQGQDLQRPLETRQIFEIDTVSIGSGSTDRSSDFRHLPSLSLPPLLLRAGGGVVECKNPVNLST